MNLQEQIYAALKETYIEVSNTYSVNDLPSDEDKVACVASYFRNKAQDKIEEIFKKYNGGWIPSGKPPKNTDYILLHFSNFSTPMIGRYEIDERGGAFFLGDCDGEDTCVSQDLFVNAWQPLPEKYKGGIE